MTPRTLTNSRESIKAYSVKKITAPLHLSADPGARHWEAASPLTDFQYPWEKDTAPATVFKALHSEEWFYCLFDVEDSAVFVRRETDQKNEVASSTRAEIFFKADDRLDPYYCLEIDPIGRVLDYEGKYHRKFNMEWSWPKKHLLVKTERRDNGYSVEVAVTKSSLRQLGLLTNNMLHAGIFRADCRQSSSGEIQFRWISWVKPDSQKPDFHIPSSFGVLRLED